MIAKWFDMYVWNNCCRNQWDWPPTCSITTSISSPFSMLRSFGVWVSWSRSPSNRNRTLLKFSCFNGLLRFASGSRHPWASWVGCCSWSWKKPPLHPVWVVCYLALDFEVELFCWHCWLISHFASKNYICPIWVYL